MERIREAHLQSIVDTLNTNAGFNPKEVSYNTVGAYELDYAYGGVKLNKITNNAGGVTTVSNGGYGTKRELYNQLWTILNFQNK